MKASPKQERSKWLGRGLVFGMTILYLAMLPLMGRLGGDATVAFSAVPVAAMGWYFGVWGGLATGLFVAGVHVAYLIFVGGETWAGVFHSGFIAGTSVSILVGLVAGGLQRVLGRQREVESALRARDRYLSLIGLTTQDLLTPASVEEHYFDAITHLTNLLVADYGHLILWDASRKKATLVASTRYTDKTATLDERETAIVSQVLQNGRALSLEDAVNSGLTIQLAGSEKDDQPPRSLIYIPLITQEKRLGVVLLAFHALHRFSPNEIQYAELACKQVALALWDTLQDAEIQRRLHEAHALADINRAISETERVGLDHTLQRIVDSARDLIPGTEQAVIHLLDEEQQVLIPRAVTGFNEPMADKINMRLGEGVAGQVIAEGITINIADVETDPRFLRQNSLPRFRSLVVAPLQSGKTHMGTISVQSAQVNAFSVEATEVLEALGAQASVAIENARLLETTQQGLKEVNALYHIMRGLAASLDTEELMRNVVTLLHDSFGYYHVQIYMLDPKTRELVAKQGSGTIGMQLSQQEHRLAAGVGIIGHVAETGQPFMTNEAENTLFFVSNPLLPNTQSEMAVPIKINERVMGVLNVEQEPPNRLTERDLQLVVATANQLAAAIQKASLYSDLQVALAQEKAVRSQLVQSERLALVGRLLASVSHELNNPLQAIQNALFLLKEDSGLTPQGRQDLQIIISETERMAGLIERLRVSYRPTHLEGFQPIQVNNIVEDVYALMSTHLRHKEIAFVFRPGPELPSVFGLPDQLRQVTLNLFINAVEAMPSGGSLTVSTEIQNQEEIALSVSDTGAGIEEDILPNIFDAFITNKEGGTGLGLTISYDIIQRHHGRIQASNNPDCGATFTVWLPIYQEKPS